jgi:hypothetical protein
MTHIPEAVRRAQLAQEEAASAISYKQRTGRWPEGISTRAWAVLQMKCLVPQPLSHQIS